VSPPGRDLEDVRARLESLSEELADLALDRLREAADSHSDDDRTRLAAEERRLTRARRAVEKAAFLLNDQEGD
jgi:hypothetical protein